MQLPPTIADSPRQRLLQRIERVLACPDCGSPLQRSEARETLVCPACGARFAARDGQFVFWSFPTEELTDDWLNRLKERAKRRLKRYYPAACRLIAPVYGQDIVKPFLATFNIESQLVADIGCGTNEYREPVACIDGVGYRNVHVVANLDHLPFQDESLAGIISVAVLEHAQNPQAQVAEIRRVLKPGGRVLCFIPFIQGFHASPHDYQRYTQNGLRELFGDFEVVNLQVGAGPTSGLLWILQEWLALVLSFGSMRLYRLLVPCTWVLSPLKYLDLLLARHPAATVIASGHFIEARKEDGARASQ
jgi:SAM-dependent methyltransferase/DNA-directed RNA polymerase subunit RPC12/RpoP